MYNTTYKVPKHESNKTDWGMVVLFLVCMAALFIAFAKAVDGPGQKPVQTDQVVKQMKGNNHGINLAGSNLDGRRSPDGHRNDDLDRLAVRR